MGTSSAIAPDRLSRRCAVSACRSCAHVGLHPVIDLGDMALTARFASSLTEPQKRYPLEVALCPACSLMQVLETVPAEEMFKHDYPYYSSVCGALVDHVRRSAESIIATRGLGADSLVMELASNDGYMLRSFVEASIPCLGIDPADGPARAANEAGVPTLVEFFTADLARSLAAQGTIADVVLANNVLAHVPDLNGFVEGIATVLGPEGVAVIEAPYVRDLVDRCEFDTIYHEHFCYFSATALTALFRRHGLFINEVERTDIHGGSLRIVAEKRSAPGPSIRALLEEERERGMADIGYYECFADRVDALTTRLREMIESLRAEGASVAAYGAAAKGAIMLGAAGLDVDHIDFVADRNERKHGRFLPGTSIQVRPAEYLLERMPEYALLLAWNFKDEILAQQSTYRERGGRFIVPVPSPEIV